MEAINIDYLETHFDIVAHLVESQEDEKSMAHKQHETIGKGGLYDLAKELTDEFYEKHKNTIWGDELDYTDTMYNFLTEKEKAFN